MVEPVRRLAVAVRHSLLPAFLTLLVSKLAVAQPSAVTNGASRFNLDIAKDEAAATCPDAGWFRERIAVHAGRADLGGDFAIFLGKRGDFWSARIRRSNNDDTGPTEAERTLQDRSSACQPLAEAVAITIAIMAEGVAAHAEPAPPPPPPPQPPVREPTASPKPKEHSLFWVGAGGGVAMSWISPVAPVLGFSAALNTERFRHGVRLMLTTEQKFDLVPGRVVVQAWLATAFSCAQVKHGRATGALCATVDASILRASAEGFEDGTPSSRSYGALGLETHPGWYILNNYRISAALGAFVPFSRESFSVIGKGVAYVPPSLNWRVLLFSEIGAF